MVKTRVSTLGTASRVVQGTYTGDGAATQAIIGLGFQPMFVIVYCHVDSTNSPAFEARASLGIASVWIQPQLQIQPRIDHIVSMDADGFTVGDGSVPPLNVLNVNGRDYTYIAWG